MKGLKGTALVLPVLIIVAAVTAAISTMTTAIGSKTTSEEKDHTADDPLIADSPATLATFDVSDTDNDSARARAPDGLDFGAINTRTPASFAGAS